ncbi:hypothetical protein [Motilibacter peucedani]|uniref:hypothetical protein n=1 Tax=Motilibacter peucedani TaxID=598650 RepID=UPI0011C39989|nr:hypothetical protein [Motilibacter peucedani]
MAAASDPMSLLPWRPTRSVRSPDSMTRSVVSRSGRTERRIARRTTTTSAASTSRPASAMKISIRVPSDPAAAWIGRGRSARKTTGAPVSEGTDASSTMRCAPGVAVCTWTGP